MTKDVDWGLNDAPAETVDWGLNDRDAAKEDLPAGVTPSAAGAGRGTAADPRRLDRPVAGTTSGMPFGALNLIGETAPPDPEAALNQAARRGAAPPPSPPEPPPPKPYADRREALDDAVNLLEEGADTKQVVEAFNRMGIGGAEIEAHGVARKTGGQAQPQGRRQIDQYTAPGEPPAPVGRGTMQAWEPSNAGEVANVARRGATQAGQIADALKFEAGLLDAEGMTKAVVQSSRDLAKAAPSGDVAAGLERLQAANKTEDYAVVGKELLKPENWKALASIVAESMISTAPGMVATIAANRAGGPIAGFAAGTASSFAMEYGSALGETLENNRVDLSQPLQVRAALENKKLLAEARERGVKRGIPVALFDGLSAGFAGRFMKAVNKAVETGKVTGRQATMATVGALGKEGAMQAGAGMAGEATAQAMVGENKPLDVYVEGLAEVPGGFGEAYGNLAHTRSEMAKREEQAKRLKAAGEHDVAATMQRQLDADRAEIELGQFAGQPWTNGEGFQDRYRQLRTEGKKPAEAAARSAMASAYQELGTGLGLSETAFRKAVDIAATLPMEKVPAFFERLTTNLSNQGLAATTPEGTIEGALSGVRDAAVTTVMGEVYGEESQTSTMQSILELEGQQEPVKGVSQLPDEGNTQVPSVPSVPGSPDGETVAAVDAPRGTVEFGGDDLSPNEHGAHQGASSPRNDKTASKGQILAGVAALGHMKVGGLGFSVENATGSERVDLKNEPPKWRTPMQWGYHYGYFRRTVGADEEHVDAFVREGTPEDYDGPVFVVDQLDPQTGKFDEHKVMVGPASTTEAVNAYRKHYAPGWKGAGAVTEMSMAEFKKWVRDGKKTEPAGQLTAEAAAPDQATAAGGQGAGADPGAVETGADASEAPAAVAPLRIGTTPTGADPVTVRAGVVYIGKYEALDFESGDPVTVPEGASDEQIRKALKAAGVVSGRLKLFGGTRDQPVNGVSRPATAEHAARTLDEDGRAIDGKPILPGDTFATATGRATTPYPKQKGEKYASQWLIDNAVAEALARGDDFNAPAFERTTTLKGGELTDGDRASMLLYLFSEQPAVVPRILKDLKVPPAAPAAAAPSNAGQKPEAPPPNGGLESTPADGRAATAAPAPDREAVQAGVIALRKRAANLRKLRACVAGAA